MWNKIKENGIVLAVIVLSVAAVILFQLFGVKSYSRYSTDSLHYEQGKVVEVSNYLTKTHNVYAKNGMKLIINADTPENVQPYYTVYNYDRNIPILSCCIILAAAIICIGRGKGIKAILGLGYSMFIICCYITASEWTKQKDVCCYYRDYDWCAFCTAPVHDNVMDAASEWL